VEVDRLLAVDLLQAMGAMALVEAQLPRSVQDHQEVTHEPAMVQGLHAQQALDHFPPQQRQRRRGHAPQEIVERVGVRDGFLLGTGQDIEIGQRLGAVQLKTPPPPRAQLEQEAHQAHPEQEAPAVGDAILVAPVADLPEPVEEVGEEMGDGLGQYPAQL
jgi:hypothetical protein